MEEKGKKQTKLHVEVEEALCQRRLFTFQLFNFSLELLVFGSDTLGLELVSNVLRVEHFKSR